MTGATRERTKKPGALGARSTWASLSACACAVWLLAGCASVEPVVAPAFAPAPVATAAPAPPPLNPERRKLMQAFGGEYVAPAVKAYIDDILTKLAPASQTPTEPYRVTLLDSPVVNAFALPSGDIFVTRGLLGLADDGAEVAAVMAHEIGHVTAHHAAQRAELERTASLFARISDQVLGKPAEGQEVAARMKLTIAHFSREQEFEADRIGIKVIAKAGFDPYAAARFLDKLGRWSMLRSAHNGGGTPDKPDMMATHPSTPERIAAAVSQARLIGAPGIGDTASASYLNAISGLAYGDNPAQGLAIGVRFLHPKLGFAFTAPEGFALENQSAALIGVGETGTQALRLDSIEANASTTLESALASGWIDGVQTNSIETINDADVPMAIAVAKGEQWTFRLGAIRHGSRIYRLIFAAHTLSPAVDARFLGSIRSFHRLTPQEAAEARESHMQIVVAQPGETSESMSQRLVASPAPLDEFLILNGLERGSPLISGQRYKVVAP